MIWPMEKVCAHHQLCSQNNNNNSKISYLFRHCLRVLTNYCSKSKTQDCIMENWSSLSIPEMFVRAIKCSCYQLLVNSLVSVCQFHVSFELAHTLSADLSDLPYTVNWAKIKRIVTVIADLNENFDTLWSLIFMPNNNAWTECHQTLLIVADSNLSSVCSQFFRYLKMFKPLRTVEITWWCTNLNSIRNTLLSPLCFVNCNFICSLAVA